MCEIDITRSVLEADPYEFSASRAERGDNAGPETWRNAVQEGTDSPLLTTEEHLDALRQWAKETGAWDAAARAAWSPAECNALFIQIVSGDMREAGIDDCFPDEFDWEAYQARVEAGQINGNIYRADDGRIYYYLGN